VVAVTSPTYLPLLVKDPTGRTLVMVSFAMIIVGIFWIRNIIRIRV
jgi:tight adherence protein B